MPEELKLNRPWLVAVWPGMGQVALSAGYYMMAKFGMHLLAEFSPRELFEVEHVEVENGLIRVGRLPRSRLFVWHDPKEKRDIIVFIGEAQPPTGKYAFCHRLIEHAQQLGVERVFTFAAMATNMHPDQPSHVFGAVTKEESIEELRHLEVELLEQGHISGLNGVLLGAAAEAGISGTCLLGEMPHLFAQLPYPKASLAVLEVFVQLAGITIDLAELFEQAEETDRKLTGLMTKVENALKQRQREHEDEATAEEFAVEPEEDALGVEDEQRIEELFDQARQERSKAYELKRELDRLEVFADYEDRFLDLFQEPG
jgi:proteasome assembly chaperone (PAC2) family protein